MKFDIHRLLFTSPDATKLYAYNGSTTTFWRIDHDDRTHLYTLKGQRCRFSDDCRHIYLLSYNTIMTYCAFTGELLFESEELPIGIMVRRETDDEIEVVSPVMMRYLYVGVIPSLGKTLQNERKTGWVTLQKD
jgi:hypothetical protein